MLSRRICLGLAPFAAIAMLPGASSAARPLARAGILVPSAADPLAVEAPNLAVGAIAKAIGEDAVEISISELSATTIRLTAGGEALEIATRILLKGEGGARNRFLDDARNASRVGGHIRDLLSTARPDQAERFAANHKAWSRAFVRKVLGWTKRLAECPVAGKRVQDLHGRIYLLGWAGAKISPRARLKPKLADLPAGPEAATPGAYEAYIEQLVAAVT